MFRKKDLYVASFFILLVFFTLVTYLMYSINNVDENNEVKHSSTTNNVEAIEHNIKLKAINLPEEYKKRHVKDIIVSNFTKNLKTTTNGLKDLNKLWDEYDRLITKDQIFDSSKANIGNMVNALKTAKILLADTYSKGTQLKFIFKLEGNHLAVFKPQWYDRDKVIIGNVYAGKDRYGSEILAFYLAAILDLRLVPIATERVIDVKKEILPVATDTLNSTTFQRRNLTCIYGKCYYCKREDPVCEDDEGKLRGAILFHIPGKLQSYNSPWQRTYKSGKKAPWEIQTNYCSTVKSKLTTKRLLDLIDVSIFDFLLQNGDRHHYETLNDKVVLIDNGKGLGNPYVHHIDILAPLYQCCVVRSSTWKRLKLFSAGLLKEILQSIAEVKQVVSSAHLQAIEERLNIVYATVENCKSHNNILL